MNFAPFNNGPLHFSATLLYGVYLALFAWFLRGKARLAVFGLVAAAVLFGALLGLGPDLGERSFDRIDQNLGQTDAQAAWVARGLTVFGDVPGRFELLAYRPVAAAVNAFGWFGAGLGTGAQGAQHFGGGARAFGGSSEGGLGKITMDLGVPGLV